MTQTPDPGDTLAADRRRAARAPAPRGVEERIAWFLSHSPGGVGWCARHTWRSLGGDQGMPPAWGCPDANSVAVKVRAAGRYWTTVPPRGAIVLWPYGANGHAALSAGNGRIVTTDPAGQPGGTGIEPLDYPRRWGAGEYLWTDTYNGVRIPMEDDDVALSDDDIERIAQAVWARRDPGTGRRMGVLLRRAYTMLGGAPKGDDPA